MFFHSLAPGYLGIFIYNEQLHYQKNLRLQFYSKIILVNSVSLLGGHNFKYCPVFESYVDRLVFRKPFKVIPIKFK